MPRHLQPLPNDCLPQEVLTPEQLLDPIERIPAATVSIANTAGTKNVSSFVAQTAPEHPVSRSQFLHPVPKHLLPEQLNLAHLQESQPFALPQFHWGDDVNQGIKVSWHI